MVDQAENTGQDQLAVLTFSINERYYALPISDVIEVAAMVESTPVPDSSPELLGVINRHGNILPLLDMRRIFGISPKETDVSTLFIVASNGIHTVGLVVDTVFQVEYIKEEKIEATPAYGNFVKQIVTQDTAVIQIIALAPLIQQHLMGQVNDFSKLTSDSELWS